MAENGYFLVADVLGFGKIVQNSTEDELDKRIAAWVALVENTAAANQIYRLQLISDTLFVAVEPVDGALGRLIAFSRQLLSEGIENSFPVRGSIVHGGFNWGKLTYGRAVISAHELEQNQNWIGIACAPDIPHLDQHWGLDKLICYPPPLKKGAIRLQPVVSWAVPSYEQLIRLMMSGGLTRQNDLVGWEIGEKLTNTVMFQLYQDILQSNGSAPSQFYGSLPIHAVELAMSTAIRNAS